MNHTTPEENFKTWRKMCEEAFGFLTSEFDCLISDEKSLSLGAYSLYFKNKIMKIKIFFAPTRLEFNVSIGEVAEEKDYDLLELVIVQGGKIRFPKTGFAEHLNRNELKEEVEVDYEKSLRVDNLYDEEHLRGVLSQYAKLLRRYAISALEGDLSVFKRIDEARTTGPILKF